MPRKKKPEPLGRLNKTQVKTVKSLALLREEYKSKERIIDSVSKDLFLLREQLVGRGRVLMASIYKSLEIDPIPIRIDPETFEVFAAQVVVEDEFGNDVSALQDSIDPTIIQFKTLLRDSVVEALEIHESQEDTEEDIAAKNLLKTMSEMFSDD